MNIKKIIFGLFGRQQNEKNIDVFEISASNLPDPDLQFKKEFDKVLDECEFDEQTISGILFYLGATLPTQLGSDLLTKDKSLYLKIISLYSKSTGDFADYGELSDDPFHYWIYNINHLINKLSGNKRTLNNFLRKVSLPSGRVMTIGETKLDEVFQKLFENSKLDLNTCQNILDTFFKNLGKELLDKEFDRQKAYEAGMAFRMMQMSMDIQGFEYMLKSINKIFTPLYQSLFNMPELFVLNKKAFEANHIFSHILNNFYGGQGSKLFQFAEAIHRFHQYVFYKPESIEIKDEWPFAKKSDLGSAIKLYINALQITRVEFDKNYSQIVKESGELFDSSVVDKSIKANDFINVVLRVIYKKYGVDGRYEFTEAGGKKGDWLDDGKWNHKGDYLQFLVLLWYETCLHSLATKEIK